MQITTLTQVNTPKIISTDDGKKYEKAGLRKSVIAVILAKATGEYVRQVPNRFCSQFLNNTLEQISQNNTDEIKLAAQKAIENSHLDKLGVKVFDINQENATQVLQEIENAIPEKLQKNSYLKKYLLRNIKNVTNYTKIGKSSGYIPAIKSLIINKSQIPLVIFHELGHVLNKENKLINILNKTKHITPFAITLFTATALFKRKKADGEKPKNNFDKITTFVKNNVGKLTILAYLPTIIEEGLASIKANQLAKILLSAENIKILNKTNFRAWLTYVISALITSASIFAMAKTRDIIAQPKEITTNQTSNKTNSLDSLLTWTQRVPQNRA